MRTYQKLEAYQLARMLLAFAYSSTGNLPDSPDPRLRLRHSALSAASHLFDWYTGDRQPREEGVLQETLTALDEVATSIDDCLERGHLTSDSASRLLTVKDDLAKAVHREVAA